LFTLRRPRRHPTEVPEIAPRHRPDDSAFLTEHQPIAFIPFLSIPGWPATGDHNRARKTNPSFTTFVFDPAVRGACGPALSSRPRAHVSPHLPDPEKLHPYVSSHPRALPARLGALSTANVLTTRNVWPDTDWHLRPPEGPVGTFARISLLLIAASSLLLASALFSSSRRHSSSHLSFGQSRAGSFTRSLFSSRSVR
jgi:hypothetical protein